MSLFLKKSIAEVQEDLADEERSLKRELNAWDIAVMGVAVAVGAGIFSVGAQAAADYAGPAVIVSFVIAAVVCGLAAMNYAEFASSVPVSGSAYTFSYLSLGELVAWIIGWDLILEMLMAGSVISKYWGIYLQSVFDFLNISIATEFHIGGVGVSWPPVVIVAFFTVLLVFGTKLTSRVNSVLTVIKVCVVLLIIVAGASYVKVSNYSPFLPPSEPAGKSSSAADVMGQSLLSFLSGSEPTRYGLYGLLGASALVFFAFIGFDIVATTAEEAKDPQKTLPRGIFGGLAMVTVLYIAVTVVVTGMVSYKDLAKQDDPSLATAFKLVGADWAGTVITIGILIGLTTVIMVLLLGLTRVVFAMSRDGLLPRGISETSSRGTPARVQIMSGIIVALIASVTDVDVLSEMINIGTLSAFVLVSFSVPVLRHRYPDLPRGFRVPFSPWLPIISGLACLWLMSNLAVETWLRFVVWLLAGLAIYFGYSFTHSRVQADAHRTNPLLSLGEGMAAEIEGASPSAIVEEGLVPATAVGTGAAGAGDGVQVVSEAAAASSLEDGGQKSATPSRSTSTRVTLAFGMRDPMTRISLVLVVLAVLAVAFVALSLMGGEFGVQAMPTGVVWAVILAAVPGLVFGHIALNRATQIERDWDLAPAGSLPVGAGIHAATRAPLRLLSTGYATMGIAVIIGIIHAIEVL